MSGDNEADQYGWPWVIGLVSDDWVLQLCRRWLRQDVWAVGIGLRRWRTDCPCGVL